MIRCITDRWDMAFDSEWQVPLKNVEFDNLAAFEMYLMAMGWKYIDGRLIEGEDWELV